MAFDWSEYLYLAQQLARNPANPSRQEAQTRSAISRAYYAAFIKARNHLRDNEGVAMIRRTDAHEYVITLFRDSRDKVRRQIGQDLRNLRSNRNKADYDDNVTDLAVVTQKSLRLAEGIILQLRRL